MKPETRLEQLKVEIALGSYHVDPKAVADAIVRRLLEQEDDRRPNQNECS